MKVVAVSSHTPTAPYYCYAEFLASVRRYGHEPLVLSEGFGGLATKLAMLKAAIESGKVKDDYIIFTDAWDVLFQDDPALAVARAILDHKGKIVFNAEKNLFPPNNDIQPTGDTLWKYLNSGFSVGSLEVYRQCLNAIDPNDMRADRKNPDGSYDNPEDQSVWQKLFLSGQHPIALDTICSIAQATHGVTEDELDFRDRKIRNVVTNETPVALHLNGSKEVWKDKVLAKLGL